jgi:ABC-2 type transport system permease protein
MVLSDLKQRVRDFSVLVFAVLVPLALMFVMNLVLSGVADEGLQPITVAVSVPEGDQLAAVLPQVLGSASEGDLRITLREAGPGEVRGLVDDGTAGLGVVVPADFTAALTGGRGPEVEVVRGDDSGIAGSVVTAIVDGVLAQLTAGTRAAVAAAGLGVPPAELAAVAQAVATEAPQVTWTEGRTATEQLGMGESIVAGQSGMFLLFTVGFGVLALVTERGQGTLGRLLSMPMKPWLIVLAKGIVSFVLGILATSVLLVAGGTFFEDVDFGSPLAVGALVLLVVAATTSIMFVIAKVARTAEQAGIAQAIVAVSLGMSGGAFFPVTNSGWVGQLLSVNPVKAFTNGLGITAGGGGVGDLGPTALTMAVFTVACLALAWVLPQRKDVL